MIGHRAASAVFKRHGMAAEMAGRMALAQERFEQTGEEIHALPFTTRCWRAAQPQARLACHKRTMMREANGACGQSGSVAGRDRKEEGSNARPVGRKRHRTLLSKARRETDSVLLAV